VEVTRIMESIRRRLVLASLAAASAYLFVFRPWRERWEGTPDEKARVLPGDELIADPDTRETVAITIEAPPEAVWPWLAGMAVGPGGPGRAGPGHPAGLPPASGPARSARVGDTVMLSRSVAFRVVALDEGRSLLLWREDPARPATWVVMIEPVEMDRTRLVERVRVRADRRGPRQRRGTVPGLAVLLTTREHMLAVKRGAERSASAS
jgi:hypothetical protein